MKKTNSLKWAAYVLAAVMAAATFPKTIAASRAEGMRSTDTVTVKTADGAETGFDNLTEAFENAEDQATVYLNTDAEMAFFNVGTPQQKKPTLLVENKSVTLDGQGHTVTAEQTEAFSMIEVRTGGKLTIRNIVMDGSASDARRFSNIINIEGGEVTIEKGTVLRNNCTTAVGIGTNVPGGKCVMNDGIITQNVMSGGSNDTGVAVTVLEGSTFIMNGGVISENQMLKYGSSGIMVNRGGAAILNGGYIENNVTGVKGMGSAVHVKGGKVELNGAVIRNNTSANGYGAVYVTNHSSFGNRWDGVLDINGGIITGNRDADGTANAIYLWSRSSIKDTGAYLNFSGSPKIEGTSRIMANRSDDIAFFPLRVKSEFTPKVPVELDIRFAYIVGETIVEYADGVKADSSHFVAAVNHYGFQEDAENNLLYTEEKRNVVFMDGDQVITSYWEFVKDKVREPEYAKPGYTLEGWYTDTAFTEEWCFADDSLPRETGDFILYSKWSAALAEAPVLTDETEIRLSCDDDNETVLVPEFEEKQGYTYSYLWKNNDDEAIGSDKTLSVASPLNNESASYTLTVVATRTDNQQKAEASTAFTVSRDGHEISAEWKNSATRHWKECAGCGQKWNEADHVFEWVIDKEATETEAGFKHKECTVCGYKEAAVEIPEEDPATPETGVSRDIRSGVLLLCAGIAGLIGTIFVMRRPKARKH